MMNRSWLLQNADAPIRRILAPSAENAGLLLQNSEAGAWFSRLVERSDANHIGDIHGSHDYRMENILGKCWILGLSKDIPAFADKMIIINAAIFMRHSIFYIFCRFHTGKDHSCRFFSMKPKSAHDR